jgi:acyl-CoA thioesterase-2
MGTPLDDLVDMLDLERLEVNLFRGVSLEEGRTRVFGGQVLAQALVAAGRTVDAEIPVHSLHAYFLRPGDPETPIVFDDRIATGAASPRRVVHPSTGRS